MITTLGTTLDDVIGDWFERNRTVRKWARDCRWGAGDCTADDRTEAVAMLLLELLEREEEATRGRAEVALRWCAENGIAVPPEPAPGYPLFELAPKHVTGKSEQQTKQKRNWSQVRAELNVRAREYLIKHRERRVSARELADVLACSPHTVAKLHAYIAVTDQRQATRPRPRGVNLSKALESQLDGKVDRQRRLEYLIDDQNKDYEPSPLKESSQRVRCRKRV